MYLIRGLPIICTYINCVLFSLFCSVLLIIIVIADYIIL